MCAPIELPFFVDAGGDLLPEIRDWLATMRWLPQHEAPWTVKHLYFDPEFSSDGVHVFWLCLKSEGDSLYQLALIRMRRSEENQLAASLLARSKSLKVQDSILILGEHYLPFVTALTNHAARRRSGIGEATPLVQVYPPPDSVKINGRIEWNPGNVEPVEAQAEILGEGNTTNVVVLVGRNTRRCVFKSYKQITTDLEPRRLRTLMEAGFSQAPRLLGQVSIHYAPGVVGVCAWLEALQIEGDGGSPIWQHFLEYLRASFEPSADPITPEATGIDARDRYLETLVETTRRFHSALNSFVVPETLGEAGVRALGNELSEKTRWIEGRLEQLGAAGVANWRGELVLRILRRYEGNLFPVNFSSLFEQGADERLASLARIPKLHIHQDYQLGNIVLVSGRPPCVTDLEGDPQLSPEERSEPQPVYWDYAAMVRACSYIKFAALQDGGLPFLARARVRDATEVPEEDSFFAKYVEAAYLGPELLGGAVPDQIMTAGRFFSEVYAQRIATFNVRQDLAAVFDLLCARARLYELRFRERLLAGFEQESSEMPRHLVHLLVFLTRRALNEICYELKYRPANVLIPLLGYLDLRREWLSLGVCD